MSDLGPGPYPNVLDIPTPHLQGVGIFITFFFPALATVSYALRIYARVKLGTLGLDDYLCGGALVSAILVSATLYMCKSPPYPICKSTRPLTD